MLGFNEYALPCCMKESVVDDDKDEDKVRVVQHNNYVPFQYRSQCIQAVHVSLLFCYYFVKLLILFRYLIIIYRFYVVKLHASIL